MLNFKTKHFLTGEELTQDELLGLLDLAAELKRERKQASLRSHSPQPLLGQHVALLFEKPSLRTRMSFSVAVNELGGSVIESLSSTSKKEEPEDVARVLSGYVHAVMVRTHEHSVLTRMAAASRIPIINGLSDAHHPCQALADILTLKEKFGSLAGLKLAYIGDGNNVLHSLLLLLPFLGATVSYACPRGYEPNGFVVRRAKKRAMESSGAILPCATPQEAVRGANAVYTDVWTSMGFEDSKKDREKAFSGYQLNAKLMSLANPAAIAMHCLPMIREREITTEVADGPASELFNQSENRLHSQKALLIGLLNHE